MVLLICIKLFCKTLTTDHHQVVVAEWSNAPIYLSWRGVGSNPPPPGTYIFILSFSPPPRSKHVSGAHANEIKHDDSPLVILF